MKEEEALEVAFNPFDSTKVWPQEQFPLMEVGELVLNRNVNNFFADNEQSAFSPANVVPGIGFSPDKLLQGRLFSYPDAQRYRLGVNHFLIPVNMPKCPFKTFHRAGAMRTDGNLGASLTYEPNRMGEWKDQPAFEEPPLLAGLVGSATHWNHRADADYFSQPGNVFRRMSQEQKLDLYGNTARELGGVPDDAIKWRHVRHCTMADVEWGAGVAEALGLPFPPSASVSGWDADLVHKVSEAWAGRDPDVKKSVEEAVERMRARSARGGGGKDTTSATSKGGILSMLGMGGADKSQNAKSGSSATKATKAGANDAEESKEEHVSAVSASVEGKKSDVQGHGSARVEGGLGVAET